MLYRISLVFVLTAILAVAADKSHAGNGLDERAQSSRLVVKKFFGALKSELIAGLKSGPVNAIGICNERAPEISDKISTEKNWRVARTSLKIRNPANAPDDWERAVLEKFDARKAAGEDPKKMEYSEIVEADGKKYFRYMKAIPTAAKPCLACHGSDIAPKVKVKLSELYPEDRARGYKPGDIRGAFTITQPMN